MQSPTAREVLLPGNFTLTDIAGCTAAVFAYLPFLFGPGFCIAFALDLFRFRSAGWPERFAISVCISVASTPILATLIARFSNLDVACWFLVALSFGALVFAVSDLRRRTPAHFSSQQTLALLFLLAWFIVAIGSVIDIQIGTRLYPTAASFDLALRSALTASATRTGVPPANPFYFPHHVVPLRYYYYWNVVAALPARLFGLSPRITLLTSVFWSGCSLAALVALYLKHFCEETLDVAKKSLIGIALLAVTGLDLIPTVMFFVDQKTILADMEWWDATQVTSWFDSLLWVPHHVAAVVAGLTGLLILWDVARAPSRSNRTKAVVIAALAFASSAGLSVYVTFTLALFLVVWTLVLLRSHLFSEAGMFVITGLLTVLLSLGYLHDLRQPGMTGTFASFYVRALGTMEDFAGKHIPWAWGYGLFLALMLPVYYFVELGFFALVGYIRAWKFWSRSEPLRKWETASLIVCCVSLLVASFLGSTTGNNDLGYRSVLFAQFILLLWAVPMVYRWMTSSSAARRKRVLLFQTFLALGLLGTAYQVVELRAFTILLDHSSYVDEAPWLPHTDEIGRDTYRLRAGFTRLNAHLSPSALVQYNGTNPAYVPNLFYSLHPSVEGLQACGTPFGGNPFECMQYQNKIAAAFNGRVPFTLAEANRLCDDLGIDVLVSERSDRMWALRKSWVWTAKPVVANPYFRAVACGQHAAALERIFSSQP